MTLHHCISLHRSLDCLIAWGHKAFVSGRTSERWRWTSGKAGKRQFLMVCARNILSICAVEFRGCKSWPKRELLSILSIFILDTYLGPASSQQCFIICETGHDPDFEKTCRVSCWSASWRMLGSDVSELRETPACYGCWKLRGLWSKTGLVQKVHLATLLCQTTPPASQPLQNELVSSCHENRHLSGQCKCSLQQKASRSS